MAELVPEAEELAGILTRVVNGTVTSNVSFVVTHSPRIRTWRGCFQKAEPCRPHPHPVTCPAHDAEPLLWINATFQVRPDESEEHLAVQQSVFSLVVDERTKRPVIRLEYEPVLARNQTTKCLADIDAVRPTCRSTVLRRSSPTSRASTANRNYEV